MNAENYWALRYSNDRSIEHHARQNEQIAEDFSKALKEHGGDILDALTRRLVVEIGCGTGDLARRLCDVHYNAVMATDFSEAAVTIAQARFDYISFQKFDIIRDDPLDEKFDTAIASNVLEHFNNPFRVIDKMFSLADNVVVIVPFGQLGLDGYDGEGGAGHVHCFLKHSFDAYKVVDEFFFETEGWVHRSQFRERPIQWAVLLNKP